MAHIYMSTKLKPRRAIIPEGRYLKSIKVAFIYWADKISISDKELADLFASLAPLKSKFDIYVNNYIYFSGFSHFSLTVHFCVSE